MGHDDSATDNVSPAPADEPSLVDALRSLPLCDELYLAMQALNLDLVDAHLEELESDLLRQYVESERTPFPAAAFVSGLSQMWVFALYEFLRTWRQRAHDLLGWAADLNELDPGDRPAAMERKRAEIARRAAEAGDDESRWEAFEQVADPAFADRLRSAVDQGELTFRTIEAVRVTLAKHEVPRTRGTYAVAPGYGRIDVETGAITWQIALGRNEVTVVSRRELADACRALGQPNDRILPVATQVQLASLPTVAYGLKRVAVTLNDGSRYSGVLVAWNKEVVRVADHRGVPFSVAHVVAVEHDPYDEETTDSAGAPF